MSANNFLIGTVVTILASSRCAGAEDRMAAVQRSEWETQEFPKIGFIVQIPKWASSIKDQPQSWSLTAYPVQVATPPRTNVFDRAAITINKLPRTYTAPWARTLPLVTQETNQFWIAVRRDIFATNAFYRCEGLILQTPRRHLEQAKTFEEPSDQQLIADVRRILKSIQVLNE